MVAKVITLATPAYCFPEVQDYCYVFYSDCWDEAVSRSNVSKCGPRLPTSPQGVDQDVVRVDNSVARLCISWSPPLLDHTSLIIAYMITITDTVYITSAVS